MKPNQVPREDLLIRDVKILFEEVYRLRRELEAAQCMNKLACGNCGTTMDEYEANFYQCPNCKARARQLTIYDDDERHELGYYIKNQRQAMGLSYGAMARQLEIVTSETLRNYENGTGTIEIMREVICKIKEIRRQKDAKPKH